MDSAWDTARSLIAEAQRQLNGAVDEAQEKVKRDREDVSSLVEDVEAKRLKLEEEKKRMAESAGLIKDKVKLNVGGTYFTTTRTTLVSCAEDEHFFWSMFSGRFPVVEDEDGAVFIDRDPVYFREILNFLRSGATPVLSGEGARRGLIAEAEFYGLRSFVRLLRGGDDYIRIGQAYTIMHEAEDNIRALFAQDRQNPKLDDPHVLLLPIYPDVSNFRFNADETVTKQFPLLFESQRVLDPGAPAVTPTFDCFKRNFAYLTNGVLRGISWSNMVVAGGAVLAALKGPGEVQQGLDELSYLDAHYRMGRSASSRNPYAKSSLPDDCLMEPSRYMGSDVDIFLFGLLPKAANEKLQQLMDQLCVLSDLPLNIVRTKHCICLYPCNGDHFNFPNPCVQIILRLYKSPAEVLMGFDLDSVCVAYDGQQVYALPRAQRALRNGFNLVNQSRRSLTYEARLWKYAKRGFAVAIPGFDRSRINPQVYVEHACDATGLGKLLLIEAAEHALWLSRVPYYGAHPGQLAMDGTNWLWRRWKALKASLCWGSDYGEEQEACNPIHVPASAPYGYENVDAVRRSDNATALRSRTYDYLFYDALDRNLQMQTWNTLVSTPPLEWITVDPGRQMIGSFHPVTDDWYGDALL